MPARSALAGLVCLALFSPLHAIAEDGPLDAPARERLLERLRESGRVDDALLEAYEHSDWAPVVVSLEVPERRTMTRRARRDRIRERADQALLDCPPQDFRLRHRFRDAAGIAGELHLRAVLRLLRNPAVKFIGLDGGGHGALPESMPLVGGFSAITNGFLGLGVTTATLDSGVDTDHPDLAMALVDEYCECPNCCPNGQDTQSGIGAAEDDNGHGTLVAGTMLSRGIAAPIGMASGADLVAIKVLDSGLGFSATSDIVAALEWLIQNHTVEPPLTTALRVVNMSLATNAMHPDTSPEDCGDDSRDPAVSMLGEKIDVLEERGVLVVAAAGNGAGAPVNRPASTSELPAPACFSNVISVGAVWDADVGDQSFDTNPAFDCLEPTTSTDQVACFSNRPAHTNVFAPGAIITGPAYIPAEPDASIGQSLGTSFASPLVAGCAALLFAQDPLLDPAEVTSRILSSPDTVTDPDTTFSFPRLDCADALSIAPADRDDDFDDVTIGEGDNCPADFNPMQSDVDGDGIGDPCDVCTFVSDPDQTDSDMNGLGDACLCTGNSHWPGDIDDSDKVDLDDFDTLETNFGTSSGVGPSDGDQNCDGVIDGADYTLWADHFNREGAEAELP